MRVSNFHIETSGGGAGKTGDFGGLGKDESGTGGIELLAGHKNQRPLLAMGIETMW